MQLKKPKHLLSEMSVKVGFLILVLAIKSLGRDLNETERGARAAFIQKFLNKQKFNEGKIRLTGGGNQYEGNVYIYHAGRWGAVCDDSWNKPAADVVCTNLFNRSGVPTLKGQFGIAIKKYWMDDVICEGDENSLSQCKFSGWGISDCGPSETAGVICNNVTRRGRKLSMKRKIHEVLDMEQTGLRLSGGKDYKEGRVEFFFNGEWHSICPVGWTSYEALVVCKHLDLGFAKEALQTNLYGASPLALSGVDCEGNEINLFHCKHQRLGQVDCAGKTDHVAAVVCTTSLADLALDTRVIEYTAHLQDVPMFILQCAMEENCLSKSAYDIQRVNPNWQFETRRLLRFTASSLNIGNDEFRPYLPKHLWQWHLCHMHYHSMEVFATFDVVDSSGTRVAEGHKASFCLEDNTCLPGVEKKFSCTNYGDQGISVNCSDVYKYNIDCQWVDVTDVKPGQYTLKVAVNPHARIAEQQFHNNAASCILILADTYASVTNCVLGRP